MSIKTSILPRVFVRHPYDFNIVDSLFQRLGEGTKVGLVLVHGSNLG